MCPRDRMRVVVVVDDEPNIADLLQAIIEGDGRQVLAFTDPVLALSALATLPRVDLFILDVLMPGMTGYQFLQETRKGPHAAAPVIMLSALGAPDDMSKGADAGADLYLTKPFDNDDVVAGVRSLIG